MNVGQRVSSINGTGVRIYGTITKSTKTGKNVRVRWDNSRHSFLTAKAGLRLEGGDGGTR